MNLWNHVTTVWCLLLVFFPHSLSSAGYGELDRDYCYTNVVVSVPALVPLERMLRTRSFDDGRPAPDRVVRVRALFPTNDVDGIDAGRMDLKAAKDADIYLTMGWKQEAAWARQVRHVNPSVHIVDVTGKCWKLEDNPYLWMARGNFLEIYLAAQGVLLGGVTNIQSICSMNDALGRNEMLRLRPSIVVTHRALQYTAGDMAIPSLLSEIDADGRRHDAIPNLVAVAKAKGACLVFAPQQSDRPAAQKLADEIGVELVVVDMEDVFDVAHKMYRRTREVMTSR